MSVRLIPCFGCPLRQGCDLREEWRRKVSGLGLRSATFRCAKLEAEIRPGRRIEISVPYVRDVRGCEDAPSYRMGRRAVRATITLGWANGGKFTCTVDPGQIQADWVPDGTDIDAVRFRRAMRPHRILRFLAGPDWPVCKPGARVTTDGHCDRPPNSACPCDEERRLAAELAAQTREIAF